MAVEGAGQDRSSRQSRKPKAKTPRSRKRQAKGGRPRPQLDITHADPSLFDPLTPGEVADALRTLTEDRRLSSMAKVGRYRVICTEPLVVKPPHWMAGHRLARVVAYDYATDRAVDACVDLDAGVVAHLELDASQPMLSREEEALAVSVAMIDERVRGKLAIGDVPQSHDALLGPHARATSRSRAARPRSCSAAPTATRRSSRSSTCSTTW